MMITRIILSLLILIPIKAIAGNVSLAWDPSPSDGVTGYRVHVGLQSGSYSTQFTIPNQTTYTVTDLAPGGPYYFAVTAFDANGNESGYSNEVFTTVSDVNPQIIGFLVSKRFFGAVATITTDRDTSAIVRYKPSDGIEPWTVNIVTEGARRRNHTAMIRVYTSGQDVYYKIQWEVTDAEGKTTIKEGTFLAHTD